MTGDPFALGCFGLGLGLGLGPGLGPGAGTGTGAGLEMGAGFGGLLEAGFAGGLWVSGGLEEGSTTGTALDFEDSSTGSGAWSADFSWRCVLLSTLSTCFASFLGVSLLWTFGLALTTTGEGCCLGCGSGCGCGLGCGSDCGSDCGSGCGSGCGLGWDEVGSWAAGSSDCELAGSMATFDCDCGCGCVGDRGCGFGTLDLGTGGGRGLRVGWESPLGDCWEVWEGTRGGRTPRLPGLDKLGGEILARLDLQHQALVHGVSQELLVHRLLGEVRLSLQESFGKGEVLPFNAFGLALARNIMETLEGRGVFGPESLAVICLEV